MTITLRSSTLTFTPIRRALGWVWARVTAAIVLADMDANKSDKSPVVAASVFSGFKSLAI